MSKNVKFNRLDTDGTMAGNSDNLWASQKAIKTYVDTKVSTLTGSGDFATITANTASITNSTIVTNNVGSLTANTASVTNSTIITNNVGSLTANTASITNSTVIAENVTTFTAVEANITACTFNTASVNTATITDLKTVNIVDVATETSSGVTGQVVFGTSSVFVCTATDTWKKVNYDSW